MNDISKPLVSVAIPAYKERYLAAAINSVLRQTCQDFELIIVNDASPENIDSVIAQFHDTRIRYYINERNIGGQDPVANWNKCLSYAQGEYFSLICDDDIYEPSFIEEMLFLAKKYPKCNVFHSGVQIIDARENIIGQYPKVPEFESAIEYIKNVAKRRRKQTISEWMFRKSHMIEKGGYSPVPMAWGADYLSIINFAVEGGIASSYQNLVTFRKSGENISTSYDKNVEKKLLGTKNYADKLFRLVEDNLKENIQDLKGDIEEIRIFEQKATLSVTSPSVLIRLKNRLHELGIPKRMWIAAIIKNYIKRLL